MYPPCNKPISKEKHMPFRHMAIDRRANKPQGKLAQVLVWPEAALAEPKTPNSMVKTSKMMVRMTQNC